MSFLIGGNFGQDNSPSIVTDASHHRSAAFSAMQPYPKQSCIPHQAASGSFCNLPIPTHVNANEKNESDEFEAIPEGWTKHWSNTYQRHYYFNVQTGEQNWKPAPSSATLEIRSDNLHHCHLFGATRRLITPPSPLRGAERSPTHGRSSKASHATKSSSSGTSPRWPSRATSPRP